MKSEVSVPNAPIRRSAVLQAEVEALRQELERSERQLSAFEAQLRALLINELIEEQELFLLYKQQKQAKKEKRLEQKKRGKRYVEPTGIARKVRIQEAPPSETVSKEKRRLYREAMLLVHPDKFANDPHKMELATELTSQLIAIYQKEDLAALQAYHAHLLSHSELTEGISRPASRPEGAVDPDAYLRQQKEMLEIQLARLRERHTYHVLTTFQDPLAFVDELRLYYQDRIAKLRRRTRTK